MIPDTMKDYLFGKQVNGCHMGMVFEHGTRMNDIKLGLMHGANLLVKHAESLITK